MEPDDWAVNAVLAGATVGARAVDSPSGSIVRRPAAVRDTAAGWPEWAHRQVCAAAELVASAPQDVGAARLLYREWFAPLTDAAAWTLRRPMIGAYRAAHAGSRTGHRSGGVDVVDRFDLIGPDGWWRTWGSAWTPPRRRRGCVRLMLSPRSRKLTDLVDVVTTALLPTDIAWSLGCAARPLRLARLGAAVLDVPSVDVLPSGLLDALEPLLHPIAPALALPVRPGIGLVEYPDNGMSFGEHRCHLLALALRHPSGAANPMRSVAAVFTAHGIDPSRPWANAAHS